jgi:hypothetical protein
MPSKEKYMLRLGRFSKFISLICFGISVLILFVSCSSIDYTIETNNNTSQDIYDVTIDINNNRDSITPLQFLASSYETGTVENDVQSAVFKDYLGLHGYDMIENINNIPSIQASKHMTLILNNTSSCFGVQIYDSTATLVDTWNSWINHSNLAQGQYYIVLSIQNEIDNQYLNALYLFVLIVS